MVYNLDEMVLIQLFTTLVFWSQPTSKPNGEEYYEYVLVYVDDLLAIRKERRVIVDKISTKFKFKNDLVEEQKKLRGTIQKKETNIHLCWTISSYGYVWMPVANVD